MIDITEHALRGLPLSVKLHRLASALREMDVAAWPNDEGHVEVIARDGVRSILLPDDAVRMVEHLRRQKPVAVHRPVTEMPPEMIQEAFRKGLLRSDTVAYDSRGQAYLPINPDDLAPPPLKRQRI